MQELNLKVEPYDESKKDLWNQSLLEVRQSTFLFHRNFMDYHRDRFTDISLMVYDAHNRVIALFPANVSRSNPRSVQSHGGLTYGGLLLTPQATAGIVNHLLSVIIEYYRLQGFDELLYKPIPHIYHTYPSDEDLYALFTHGAQIVSRSISSVIELQHPLPFSKLRKRKVNKAHRYLQYSEIKNIDGVSPFWRLLADVLNKRHGTKPVHSLVELQYLVSAFPFQIRLFVAHHSECPSSTEHPLAGCLLFVTDRVVHVQYIASSDEGCEVGALDGLFDYLIRLVVQTYPHISYFDFGISTENEGRYLNEGLIFQKEGFGGRAVCYDTYLLKLH